MLEQATVESVPLTWGHIDMSLSSRTIFHSSRISSPPRPILSHMSSRQARRNVTSIYAAGRPVAGNEPWLPRLALGIVTLTAFTGLIGLIGQWGIAGGWFEAIDGSAIHLRPNGPLNRFYVTLSYFGTPAGIAPIALITLVLLLRRRAFPHAAALLCLLLTATFTNSFVKDWVARERPEHAGLVEAGGYAYVSGHAFVGTALYGLIALLLLQNITRPGQRFALAAVSVLFIALLGFGRIYLGVHYVTDVIAGFLLGIVWIVVWTNVFRLSSKR